MTVDATLHERHDAWSTVTHSCRLAPAGWEAAFSTQTPLCCMERFAVHDDSRPSNRASLRSDRDGLVVALLDMALAVRTCDMALAVRARVTSLLVPG